MIVIVLLTSSLILSFGQRAINKPAMVKKTEKAKLSKTLEKRGKIEKDKKKPGRKPLKAPVQSPRSEVPALLSLDDRTAVAKKPRGRKPLQRHTETSAPVGNQLDMEGTEEAGSNRTIGEESGARQIEAVQKRFDRLSETVQQLKSSIVDKIEDLRVSLNNTAKTPQPVELSPSITDWIRQTISEEISKEFSVQFEKFKDSVIESKLTKIAKLKKRGRPSKILRPTSRKSSVDRVTEPPTQKKRGRKRKTLEDLSPEKEQKAKNLSSVAEMVDDNKRDFRINNIITFSNLTEQPETHKDLIKPIETQKPDITEEPLNKSETGENYREQDTSAILPSVPLKSIQALIEDHESDLVEARKSVSSEDSGSSAARQEIGAGEDQKSVRTETEVDRNVKMGQDIDIEFDFNAFSLNN